VLLAALLLAGCDWIASLDQAIVDRRLRSLKAEFQRLGEQCAHAGTTWADVAACARGAGYDLPPRGTADVVRISRCIGTQTCGGLDVVLDPRTDKVVSWDATSSRAPLRMM